jgi:hypothetical protein
MTTTGPEEPSDERPTPPSPYGAPPPPPTQRFDQQMQQQFGTPPAPPSPYGAPAPHGQPYGQPYPQPYAQQQPYGQPYSATPPNDGMGLASMIVGIVSLVLMCGYGIGLLGAPVALGLGLASKKRIDRSEGRLGGRGFAQAGFILGIVGTVLLVLAIIVVVIIIIAGVNGAFDEPGTSTF